MRNFSYKCCMLLNEIRPKLANNIAMHLYYLLLSTKEQGDGEEERTHTKADDLLLV